MMAKNNVTTAVSGSIAYDRIMDFPGVFEDHIIPGKIHNLNVSFLVNRYSENFGGTAGNISYNLALLGQHPVILGSAGKDFSPYRLWLFRHGVNTRYVHIVRNRTTAVAHMITDRNDNQISGFHVGAGAVFGGVPPLSVVRKITFACVSPAGHRDLSEYPRVWRRNRVPYAFDPGQQISTLPPRDLINGAKYAKIFFSNDYELALFLKRTKLSAKRFFEFVPVVVTTRGPKGSSITTNRKKIHIPPAKARSALDPTGAGDAYRAGFLFGFVRGLPLDQCGRLGAVVSVYTVETYGTQTHVFTLREVVSRYQRNFSTRPKL